MSTEMKARPLWSDDKTYEDVERLADEDPHNVIYNLHEDVLCLKEDLNNRPQRERLISKAKEVISQGVGDCEPDEYLATVLVDSGWKDKKVKPIPLVKFSDMVAMASREGLHEAYDEAIKLGYIIGADND